MPTLKEVAPITAVSTSMSKVIEAKLHTPIHTGTIGEIPASLSMSASAPKKITSMELYPEYLLATFFVAGKTCSVGIPLANIKCFVLA